MASILIVDDERAIRNTLKDILEVENYKVDTAEDGKQALEKVQNNKYDLVFTDIKMPNMDGTELLEAIVKERGGSLPVIMISGHATIDIAVDAIKKGAYDFIEKPLDLNRILITTRNAIEKNVLVQETSKLKKKISAQYEMIGNSAALQTI
ncbi:MAG: response regulator, partial [Bacteroidales bacterium]|nr:response regulator [Bacteroidales bacterium]